MPVETFSDRVTRLVQTKYGGNVLEASKQIRVPYATLTRVMKEPERSPQAKTLQRIGEHFDVTVDFLLTGRGGEDRAWLELDVDEADLPFGELMQWADLLDRLPLEPAARGAVFHLPFHIRSAGLHFIHAAIDHDSPDGARWRASYKEALRLEVRAWRVFISGWVDASSPEPVAKRMHEVLTYVQLGFNPVGVRLAFTGALDAKAVAEAGAQPVEESLGAEVRRLFKGSQMHAVWSQAARPGQPTMVRQTMAEVTDEAELERRRIFHAQREAAEREAQRAPGPTGGAAPRSEQAARRARTRRPR